VLLIIPADGRWDFIPLKAQLNPICHMLALLGAHHILHVSRVKVKEHFNPLNTHLNPICHLLALLGAHHIFHVSMVRVKSSFKGLNNNPTLHPALNHTDLVRNTYLDIFLSLPVRNTELLIPGDFVPKVY
jgi:hypothetical protein